MSEPPAQPKRAWIVGASYREAALVAIQMGLWNGDWEFVDAIDHVLDLGSDEADTDRWIDAIVEQRSGEMIANFEWLLERTKEEQT